MHRYRTVDHLARGGDDVELARAHLVDLVLAARALAPFTTHPAHAEVTAPGDPCPHPHCAAATATDGAALCRLAGEMSLLEIPPTRHPSAVARPLSVTVPTAHELVERFRSAVGAAVDAVRVCRQFAHPSGTCWFSPPGDPGNCGVVLQLAHRAAPPGAR